MRRFNPPSELIQTSYDVVSESYNQTFKDIRVRKLETDWIDAQIAKLPPSPALLDLGCGNGALLRHLSSRISKGTGVDASETMLAHARQNLLDDRKMSLHQISGPKLPLEDDSIDIAIAMLSWRYLDWDPMLNELKRVLKSEGQLWVIDMVEKPASVLEVPQVLFERTKTQLRELREKEYRNHRKAMVQSKAWKNMLHYNPMRALHEYEWFFKSRFPQVKSATLSKSRRARVMAYNCGPMSRSKISPLQYP